jgi:NAD(P)H-hydrate repair Nnr-like enzyme with NAD(P)H-hydrate epimerase domain
MSIGAFSIDQLMELAGLSVSQAGLLRYRPRSSIFLNILQFIVFTHQAEEEEF